MTPYNRNLEGLSECARAAASPIRIPVKLRDLWIPKRRSDFERPADLRQHFFIQRIGSRHDATAEVPDSPFMIESPYPPPAKDGGWRSR